MKKSIKTAVAMLLAIIIACGSLTAFASTPADIQWYFWEYEDAYVYSYAGEVVVGADEVAITAKEDNCFVYFTFVAEEDGYYRVSSSECYYDGGWFGFPEKQENGAYYGVKNSFYCYKGSCCYYLEKGEQVVGVDFCDATEYDFKVEYLGTVVDMVWDENALDNLILNYNLWASENENDEVAYYADMDVTVKFSNGQDILINYASACIYTDEELTSGEYEVEICPYGMKDKMSVTINVIDIAQEITKVELSNIEDYASLVRYYTGDYYSEDFEAGTLTVTYADGTTETIENFDGYAYLEKYGVDIASYYDYNNDWDICYFINIAEVDFVSEVCTIRGATKLENTGVYNRLNLDRIGNTFSWMKLYFNYVIHSDSLSGAFSELGYFFRESTSDWLYTFAYIMRNTADIFSYMY